MSLAAHLCGSNCPNGGNVVRCIQLAKLVRERWWGQCDLAILDPPSANVQLEDIEQIMSIKEDARATSPEKKVLVPTPTPDGKTLLQ